MLKTPLELDGYNDSIRTWTYAVEPDDKNGKGSAWDLEGLTKEYNALAARVEELEEERDKFRNLWKACLEDGWQCGNPNFQGCEMIEECKNEQNKLEETE